MTNQERAKQFLPFDALEGYFDMVNLSTYEKCVRKSLDVDEQERLAKILSSFHKADMVRITYYDIDHYKTITGLISRIDYDHNTLSIVKTKIYVEDIISAYKVE